MCSSLQKCIVNILIFNISEIFLVLHNSRLYLQALKSKGSVKKLTKALSSLAMDSSQNRYWSIIGRILILGSRVTSQCCSAHAHIWRCCLLSSPGFLTRSQEPKLEGDAHDAFVLSSPNSSKTKLLTVSL